MFFYSWLILTNSIALVKLVRINFYCLSLPIPIDRDNAKWLQTRKERQKSGSIGGKARAKNLIANQANATFAKQISIGQFQKKLGLSRPQVVKILRQLVNSSLLVKKAGKGRTPKSIW